MSKPTIVMVPGALQQPDIYTGVASNLSRHGFPTIILSLPSVGSTPPHDDFSGDVAVIRKCLAELVSEGKEVVLVVHSYTSLPGGEAPKGLGMPERRANGLEGGVIRYVVINGFATPGGFQPVTKVTYSLFPPEWMKLDIDKSLVTGFPEDAKRAFYNDVPLARAEELVARIQHQSTGSQSHKATYAAWMDIPSTFIAGDADQSSFTPEMVDMMIKTARQIEPTAFNVVEHCVDGGHCLMVSHPDWTADALRRAAGEML